MEKLKLTSNPWPIDQLLKEIEAHYQKEKIGEFWSHEKTNVDLSLRALSNSTYGRRLFPSPTPVLGVGGSGIVLRMADSKFVGIDVALKFPRPVAGKISLVAEMLEKEIAQLSRLRNPGIVRIIYYDTVICENKSSVPFYIMELVDGKKSLSFAHDPELKEQQFIQLIKETTKVIAYLHNHAPKAIVHLDIKPDNIVVSLSGNPVMIDLGTCKQISGEDDKRQSYCDQLLMVL